MAETSINDLKLNIIHILRKYEGGMDDGFGGSVTCVFDDSYEDVANAIIKSIASC